MKRPIRYILGAVVLGLVGAFILVLMGSPQPGVETGKLIGMTSLSVGVVLVASYIPDRKAHRAGARSAASYEDRIEIDY